MQSSALSCRPSSWEEVVGNKPVVSSLRQLLRERTPVAIGFGGPSGFGKTTLAHLVAQEIQPEVPADQLDIRHINCADKNGVDDARALAEDAQYRPMSGRYRVHILDEAHMLTVQAQNALLIPTEAKDSHTVWIICTTEPQKLIPALKGRCAWYDLKPFGEAEIRQLFANLTSKTGSPPYESLVVAALKKGLTSPRELCYSLDRFVSGMTADDAVAATNEQDIQYGEIIQALLHSWGKAAPLLRQLKASDAKPFRVVLSYTLRSTLLLGQRNSQQLAIAELFIRIASQNSFEDSVTLASLTAALYIFASKYHSL